LSNADRTCDRRRLLEIGVLDIAGNDPVAIHAMPLRRKFYKFLSDGLRQMRHTDEELERAAERFRELAEDLDPETTKVLVTEDLRGIAEAAQAVRDDETRLRKAVEIARAHGRSWNQIAVALGVSRQAARQRFADKVRT
jgi:tRNA A37 N6-isopentenylltransferase MiaA